MSEESFLFHQGSSESSKSFESSSGDSKLSLLKKNSKTKLSKKLLIEKYQINNISKKPYKIIVPRMIDTDIRKQYPIMWMNMINGGDMSGISLFLYKFTTRSCSYEALSLTTRDRLLIEDIHQLVTYFEAMHTLFPDHTCKFYGAEIKTRSDTFQSIIHIYFRFYGSRVYELPIQYVGETVVDAFDHTIVDNSAFISGSEIVEKMRPTPLRDPAPLILDMKVSLVIEDPRIQAKITSIRSESRIVGE